MPRFEPVKRLAKNACDHCGRLSIVAVFGAGMEPWQTLPSSYVFQYGAMYSQVSVSGLRSSARAQTINRPLHTPNRSGGCGNSFPSRVLPSQSFAKNMLRICAGSHHAVSEVE